ARHHPPRFETGQHSLTNHGGHGGHGSKGEISAFFICVIRVIRGFFLSQDHRLRPGQAPRPRAATGALIGPPWRHPSVVRHAEFHPDGRRILTAALDNGRLLSVHVVHSVGVLALTSDGEHRPFDHFLGVGGRADERAVALQVSRLNLWGTHSLVELAWL